MQQPSHILGIYLSWEMRSTLATDPVHKDPNDPFNPNDLNDQNDPNDASVLNDPNDQVT